MLSTIGYSFRMYYGNSVLTIPVIACHINEGVHASIVWPLRKNYSHIGYVICTLYQESRPFEYIIQCRQTIIFRRPSPDHHIKKQTFNACYVFLLAHSMASLSFLKTRIFLQELIPIFL